MANSNFSKQELVESAIVLTQTISRHTVWLPGHNFIDSVSDLLLRRCGLPQGDVSIILDKIINLNFNHHSLAAMTVSDVQCRFGLTTEEAEIFVEGASYILSFEIFQYDSHDALENYCSRLAQAILDEEVAVDSWHNERHSSLMLVSFD